MQYLTAKLKPAREASSASLNAKYSKANLDRSGDGGLLEGGVGRDADGGVEDMRKSREGEFGPSTTRWARIKHAAAMMRGGNNKQSGVR